MTGFIDQYQSRNAAKRVLDNVIDQEYEKAFESIYFYDVASDLAPIISYEDAKDKWIKRVKDLKEKNIYLIDYNHLRVHLDDTYPVGTVDLIFMENGKRAVKENVHLWFAPKENSWRLGNFDYLSEDQDEEWEFALSGQFNKILKEETYITEEKALTIAKEMNRNGNPTYHVEFIENYNVDPSNTSISPTSVWIVTALYPFENQTILYIDAYSGTILSVAETEPPAEESFDEIINGEQAIDLLEQIGVAPTFTDEVFKNKDELFTQLIELQDWTLRVITLNGHLYPEKEDIAIDLILAKLQEIYSPEISNYYVNRYYKKEDSGYWSYLEQEGIGLLKIIDNDIIIEVIEEKDLFHVTITGMISDDDRKVNSNYSFSKNKEHYLIIEAVNTTN